MPNMFAYRPDYVFQTVIGVWEVTSVDRIYQRPTGRTTDNGVGKRCQAGLSLLEGISSSTSGFCAILSGDLDARERSLSFTYGEESWSSLEQMYFGKRRASRINLFWSR